MKTASVFGASDDLIEWSGVPGADEFSASEQEDRKHDQSIMGTFVLGGKMRIVAMYGRGSVWSFGVGQVAEEVALPDWPVRVVYGKEPASPYSVMLEIDVPDDAVLVRES